MKIHYLAFFLVLTHAAIAQNQISTPAGQNLKLASDTVVVTTHLKVSNSVFFSNSSFLSIKKTTAGELNTIVGPGAGNAVMTGRWNTLFGENAGLSLTGGSNNTFLGTNSGRSTTTGLNNTFVGYRSGYSNTLGKSNTIIGISAGTSNTEGESNVFMGLESGYQNTLGKFNVFVGRAAGYYYTTGESNTIIGSFGGSVGTSGMTAFTGSGNVFIGNRAGTGESGSNKLHIANSNLNPPLVYGEFPTSPTGAGKFVINGQVGIGVTTFPTTAVVNGQNVSVSAFQLFVNGGAVAKRVVVSNSWADYVFENDYKLKPLEEVENFIQKNGHLPGFPAGKDVEKSGLDLGDMARRQQEKIEELTLYMIEHNKQIKRNAALIQEQEKENQRFRELLKVLERQTNGK